MASEQPADNIYDRCAYLNCYNGKNSTGHKLFRFPAYNDSRHNLWIRYAGNVRLRTWSSATIRRAGICAEHFGRESFTDETRQSLRRHAVPRPYSATDAKAKASTTLLDYIRSLPRKRTRSQRLAEAEGLQTELAVSQDSSDPDDASFSPEKPMPVQEQIIEAVKTLRKVKMIKIQEQIDDSNRIVVLERCKNPETCLAKRQSTSCSEKPRPHFHKVYVNNSEATRLKMASSSSISQAKSADAQRSENVILETQSIDEGSEEPCYDVKSSENLAYRLERHLINVTKNVQEKNATTVARYSHRIDSQRRVEIAKSIAGGIHTEKGEPAMITIPDYISKKHPSTTELVKEYYRTKDERVFDRCAYLNCKNGRYTTGARLFRFPQFTDPRLNTWIKNAGNPRMLYWSPATIRRAGLCGEHFTDESFFNSTRQRLLRSALPKPFYLDDKNITGTELQDENLTHDDLLRIFDGLDEDVPDQAAPVPIDLPDEKSDRREDLKIKYPFEDVAGPDRAENDQDSLSFASVAIKNKPPDETEPDDVDESMSVSSTDTDLKFETIEQTDEDLLLDDHSLSNDYLVSDQADDIRGILKLEQEKVELCKTIKQFSTMLKNAKLQKEKLRSQLLAYRELKMH